MIDTTPMYAKLWGSSRVSRHSIRTEAPEPGRRFGPAAEAGTPAHKNRPRLLHRPRRLGDGNSRRRFSNGRTCSRRTADCWKATPNDGSGACRQARKPRNEIRLHDE